MRAHLSVPMLLLLAACGSTQVARGGVEVPTAASMYAGANDAGDPFERVNRHLYDVNYELDESVFRPVAETYRAVVPEYGRTRVRTFLQNLGEPLIFANNLLQLRFDAAGTTMGRFALNTTLGGLGLFDVAADQGLRRQTGDFGQTMARYGMPGGPYLMLPILGPSNVRDAVGDGIESFGNPLQLALGPYLSAYTLRTLNITRGALGGVDLRAENLDTLDVLRADSLDGYARLRSVIRQRRDADIMEAHPRAARDVAAGGAPAVLDDPGAGPTVLDDPGTSGPSAVAVLDDPGTGSTGSAPAAAPAQAAPRPRVEVEWAARTLRQADLATPGEASGEALPAAGRVDGQWARDVLRGRSP
ncbi:VacJ family lipoprotein [Rhodovarius crocodyli]|uniref:VacJ family lipoprotein n=1 Tax=Rhodovarius crocodyli TaxID=1979269 RepID=A0A437MK19_9PROT|nr:VacJ family lipoprotein [Rhodovarius crocodyli]RVT97935.1 VacJ family lipoprotein [Rhodovarius crocodyli]